ncbi:MAG TPA: hypothetical protein VLL54_15995 [Pyrinomonadaceae bacterium]|nr:hypothetical protein [Pyrinomonadaceae bacterium]
MIIWTGYGIVSAVMLGLFLAIFAPLTMLATREPNESLMFGFPLVAAGIINWFPGKKWNKARLGIDKETKQEVLYKPHHSLFFIPVELGQESNNNQRDALQAWSGNFLERK